MSQYFPKPSELSTYNVKVKLELSNYAKKFKQVTDSDTFSLEEISDLKGFKS